MFKITTTEVYNQRLSKFLKKHPNMEKQYKKTIKLLALDPDYPSLRLHKFERNGIHLYSISVNMEYRVSLDLKIVEKEIILINIGNHKDIYGKD